MSQLSVRDLSAALARDAEGVARYLLGPDGKREGQELRYGDVSGSPGKSGKLHRSANHHQSDPRRYRGRLRRDTPHHHTQQGE